MPIAGSDRKWEGRKKEEVASIAAADNSWPLDSSSGSVGSRAVAAAGQQQHGDTVTLARTALGNFERRSFRSISRKTDS